MNTIGTYFNLIQGHQITDEELYQTEGDIPVFTGSNDIKGYWNKSLVNLNDLPCLTYPTKGNKEGNVFVQYNIFDANNTAILIPKNEWRDKINLEWFAFKLKHILQTIQTSKENVSYLNRDLVEPYEFNLPNIDIQNKELEPIKKLREIRSSLYIAIQKIDTLLEKAVIYEE